MEELRLEEHSRTSTTHGTKEGMNPQVPKHHYVIGGAIFMAATAALCTSLYIHPSVKVQAPSGLIAVSTPGASRASTPLRILFVGDMFFDRFIRAQMSMYGDDYPFACIDPLFKTADFVIGNLEGPITANSSISLGSIPGSARNYVFTFPTTTAEVLARHNVRAVTLGNNHILNFGHDGIVQTHTYLDTAGVGYFGGVGTEPIYRVDEQGEHLSFIAYNQFGGNSAEEVAQRVYDESTAGRTVIVFAHWGTEYSTSIKDIQPLALLFVESGASAIVGSHPHIVGEHEYLDHTPVYYSLGNFIFDQYFSSGTKRGLALRMSIHAGNIETIEEYPVKLERNGQTCQDFSTE